MPFVISFKRQTASEVIRIMKTILKFFEQAILVEQFQILLNKQNEIFEIRIFSHHLNFFHFYLIQFYTPRISSSGNTHRHASSPLGKTFEKYKHMRLFSRFCGQYFNRYVDSINFQLYETSTILILNWFLMVSLEHISTRLKLHYNADMLLRSFQIFSGQLFISFLTLGDRYHI